MNERLRTKYLGLDLRSPLIAGASPLTADLTVLRQLEAVGVGAIVLPSLFEEEVEREEVELAKLHEFGAESFPEALSYFPEAPEGKTQVQLWMDHLEAAKEVLSIPVIGSLNGREAGDWVRYAREMEARGADALELNIYFLPVDASVDGREVEERYLRLVSEVRGQIDIPLAVKIGPFFSSLPNMAKRLVEAGADGLVLFNRFLQPDLDIETLQVEPTLELSTQHELRLSLRWIAILRGQIDASLASTSGVHDWDDLMKLLLVGADAVQSVSALIRNGPEYAKELLVGLASRMEELGYSSVEQLKGAMSREAAPDPEAFERANYMRVLKSFSSDIP